MNWSQFTGNIVTNFRNFRDGQEFADVTLVCDENKQVKAHKVVLSSCSEFFRNILVNNPHQHPLLYLTGISSHDLQALVDFAYLGETEVSQEHLESFLTVAKTFKIKGLIGENIEQPLENHIFKPLKTSSTDDAKIKNEGTSGQNDVMSVDSQFKGFSVDDLLEETEDAFKMSSDEGTEYETMNIVHKDLLSLTREQTNHSSLDKSCMTMKTSKK